LHSNGKTNNLIETKDNLKINIIIRDDFFNLLDKIYNNGGLETEKLKGNDNILNFSSNLSLKQNNYKQINTQYIKKNKKKDSTKEIYYQKPIINKINIYNSNNNNSNIRQKIQLSEKVVKKQLITRYNNNNLPFRI
jgi:hypothetical protein